MRKMWVCEIQCMSGISRCVWIDQEPNHDDYDRVIPVVLESYYDDLKALNNQRVAQIKELTTKLSNLLRAVKSAVENPGYDLVHAISDVEKILEEKSGE